MISAKSKFPVMARAKVVSNNDPKKLGRLRVKYPWLNKRGAQKPSEWATLSLPYASKDNGMWFLPEKDDEVIVFFENGNPDYPIILGTLYSEKIKPPASGRSGDYNENNKNDLKYVKTRSGHILCFDDSDSSKGIVVKDADNRKIEIDSKQKKVTVSDGQGSQVILEESKVSIEKGGTKITLKDGEITIDAAESIKLGADASSKLVKGTEFMQFFNAHTHQHPMGPTAIPMVPMTDAMLSTKSKTG
jgi:uncharacterized protein involved in type VI secretion and phage assembly